MATIALGGLASGLDTEQIIAKLLAVERRPVSLLETRRLKLEAISTAFRDLNTRLATLKSRADALRAPDTFFARSVTSSTDTVATATAAPGSGRGTYTLTATALARGSLAAASSTKGALTDVVASADGSFEFKLGATGSVVTVSLTAATTLEGLIADINAKNAGVKASAVNMGTAASPAWKLVLASTATGASNDIVIITDGTTLGVANTQTAQDAAFAVTGLGSFTRSSNTFSDVIEGVTITLKAGSGSTDLAVDVDKGGTQSRLQALLDAYNEVVRAIDTQAAGTKSADGTVTPGAFTGDAVPRQIRRQLATAIATSLSGPYHTLAEIGVTTEKDGTLTLDSSTLQSALTSNPQAVSDLVAGTAAGNGIADLLWGVADDTTKSLTGAIAARQDGLTATIRTTQAQIDRSLQRLEVSERMLRARFTRLEQVMASLQSTGTSLLSQLQQLDARMRG
jgi:flagellar hook-associated protein 2